MFIGELEIKGVVRAPDSDGKVEVTFEGEHPKAIINKELLDNLTTFEKGIGNIMDNSNHYFAKRFLAELASYGLEYYNVDNVATGMRVLAHNLREEAIKRVFKCSGGDSIPLDVLIKDESKDEPEIPIVD